MVNLRFCETETLVHTVLCEPKFCAPCKMCDCDFGVYHLCKPETFRTEYL